MERAYTAHAPSVLRLAYTLTRDRSDAEDVLQEAFVRVFRRRRSLREDEELAAYLHRTVVNLVRNEWRRRNRSRHFEREMTARVPTAHPPHEPGHDAVWDLVVALPVRQRAAVFFHYAEDLSDDQVAMRLGCSPAAARSLLHRAMTTLRDRVKGGCP